MNIYIVGGAVRDRLLGKTPKDMDYLVQGATVDEFLELFPDAQQVGRDFPVFLVDGEEYAFARTERSTGPNHTDFTIHVDPTTTVIEDLSRRDLTINAIACCPDTDEMICNHRAHQDLFWKVLRHNGPAFGDDPLRVLRVARFAAQFPDFSVAGETIELMRSMKDELYCLQKERVFSELRRALETEHTHRFFETLRDCDCLSHWFPEVEALIGVPAGPDEGKHKGEADTFEHTMLSMGRVFEPTPITKFAVLCHDLGKALSEAPPKHHGHDIAGLPLVKNLCERLGVPNVYRKAALIFTKHHIRMHKIMEMRPGKAVELLRHIKRCMPGGVPMFMCCSIGDGTSGTEAIKIYSASQKVLAIKLPAKYHGRGAVCKDILLNLRAEAWRDLK